MYQMGGFWAEENNPREFCYGIVPLRIRDNPRQMTVNGFNVVYHALGRLGYKFRDAGHCADFVLVSLDKPISKGHRRILGLEFFITPDDGALLGCA